MKATDRELLELAASAAKLHFNPTAKLKNGLVVASEDNQSAQYIWNPLADDGDALRLAVELKIDITFMVSGHEVGASTGQGQKVIMGALELMQNRDEPATRRAIVRAAAEIGMLTP